MSDPCDHGYYLLRSDQQIDVVDLGISKILMKGVENAAAYEYAVFVSIGERTGQATPWDSYDGQTILVDKTIPLCYKEGERIAVMLMRRTSQT